MYKNKCKRDKLETNFFRHSWWNNNIIQGISHPITNQKSCTHQLWGTGWHCKQSQRAGWCSKQFRGLFDAVSNPKSDPSSDPEVATYTTSKKIPNKLLANSEIPAIIQGIIPTFHQATSNGVLTCGRALHAVCTILMEDIITGATPSAVNIFKDPLVVDCRDASRLITIDMNTFGVTYRSTNQVLIDTGTSAPLTRIRCQKMYSARVSIGHK